MKPPRRSRQPRRTFTCRPVFIPAFQGTAAGISELALVRTFADSGCDHLTVYIVLEACSMKAYIHPITILSTLPSAGVGAILALLLTGNDLSAWSD